MKNFKPKKTEKDVISIRIETGLLEKIDHLSANIDISRNEMIIQCIQYALSNMEQNEKQFYRRIRLKDETVYFIAK